MNLSPANVWDDGQTCLNNNEDRVGALMIALFAAVLSFWLVPGLLNRFRSR